MMDSDLAERCRKGDRGAQRAIYDQTSDRIYRLLLGMTRNPDDALDLAQDTYVRAFDRIDQFKGDSTLSTWIYRIAVNEALQFLRRRKPVALGMQTDSGPSFPKAASTSSDSQMDIEEALQRVSPEDRMILLLRYQEGLDYRSVAAILDCPAGTVASRLNRARQAMREILGEGYKSLEEESAAGHQISGAGTDRTTETAADPFGSKTRSQ